jgi:hypothetical protein
MVMPNYGESHPTDLLVMLPKHHKAACCPWQAIGFEPPGLAKQANATQSV